MSDMAFEKSKELYVNLTNMISEAYASISSRPLTVQELKDLVEKMAQSSLGEGKYTIKSVAYPSRASVVVYNDDGFYNSVSSTHQKIDLDNLCGELAMSVYKANGGTKYTFAPFLVTSIQVSIAENLGLGM